jgi:acetoacetyl-CoA synthetase
MWNLLAAALLGGATAVLFDGNPLHPDPGTLWRAVAETRATCFGAGAAFFNSCMKADLEPGKAVDLSALEQIGSTGSPPSGASPPGWRTRSRTRSRPC